MPFVAVYFLCHRPCPKQVCLRQKIRPWRKAGLKLAGWMLALLPGVCDLSAADSIAIQREVIAAGDAHWSSLASSGNWATSASYSAISAMAISWPVGASTNAAGSHDGGFFIKFDRRRTIFAYDFDGDGRSDIWYYDEPNGLWYFILSSSDGAIQRLNFGGPGAVPAVDDYDGDGLADPGVYWQSQAYWEVMLSDSAYATLSYYGPQGGLPATNDYDGDGYADFAVMVPGTGLWMVLLSTRLYSVTSCMLGGTGYVPAPADFDGDRLADPAVYQSETGHWLVAMSSNAYATASFFLGGQGYLPMPADYDGDLKADPVVYGPQDGKWGGFLSDNAYQFSVGSFGGQGALPYRGDYDNDGHADLAVLSPDITAMYLMKSTEGYEQIPSESQGQFTEPAE